MSKRKAQYKQIVKEWKEATRSEIWEAIRDNFIFGFIGATLVVFIATHTDIAVLVGYLTYYSFMGKIVNRPKYVTDLGKKIMTNYLKSLIKSDWINSPISTSNAMRLLAKVVQ